MFKFGADMWYQEMDYMYIDEVQDISYDVLLHLASLTRRNVMLFGDNAQNIAKGVSIRFNYFTQELINNGFDTTYIQLTKNFRSHQNILNLGNSIVKVLSLIARGDLEIMPDENSDRLGPKPLVVKLGCGLPTLKDVLEQSLQVQ